MFKHYWRSYLLFFMGIIALIGIFVILDATVPVNKIDRRFPDPPDFVMNDSVCGDMKVVRVSASGWMKNFGYKCVNGEFYVTWGANYVKYWFDDKIHYTYKPSLNGGCINNGGRCQFGFINPVRLIVIIETPEVSAVSIDITPDPVPATTMPSVTPSVVPINTLTPKPVIATWQNSDGSIDFDMTAYELEFVEEATLGQEVDCNVYGMGFTVLPYTSYKVNFANGVQEIMPLREKAYVVAFSIVNNDFDLVFTRCLDGSTAWGVFGY